MQAPIPHQCIAMTKARKQCLRGACPSGYCYQHERMYPQSSPQPVPPQPVPLKQSRPNSPPKQPHPLSTPRPVSPHRPVSPPRSVSPSPRVPSPRVPSPPRPVQPPIPSSQPSQRIPPAANQLTLRQRLDINPNLPIDLDEPVIKVQPVTINTVTQWLDNAQVRQALQTPLVNVRHFHEDLGIPKATDLEVFNNESLGDYIDYVESLIRSLNRLRPTTPPETEAITTLRRRLTRISREDFPLTNEDIRRYIQAIYPRSHFSPMPNIGNCYFCAIGTGLDLPEDQIRQDISQYAQRLLTENPHEYADFISQNLQGCPTERGIRSQSREHIYRTFPDEIRKSCHQGDVDCIDCLWGGNSYDPTIAELYQIPVVGIIASSPDSRTIDLDLSITLPNGVTNPREFVSTYRGPIASYLGYAVGAHYDYLGFN
jgi:hypothetical protein